MIAANFSVKRQTLLLKIGIHACAFIPLLYTYYLATVDQLGGDPVEAIIHFTGIGAFNLLLITLSVTPLAKYFKLKSVMNTRRLLGIYAFTYAFAHVLNFLFFEVQFDLTLFIDEVFERPYITVGMVAAILLLSLAVTSLNGLKRKMGKAWQAQHNLIYLIVILVAIHFYWSVKSEIIEPMIYITMTVGLLYFRHHKFKRWLRSILQSKK